MMKFILEKPRMERMFIKLLNKKPKFLFEERFTQKSFRAQIYFDMNECYEKLGLLICDEFLQDRTISKYVDTLVRDLESLEEIDYRIYMNYLHYTKYFLEQVIQISEENDEFETAHNFTRVLDLYLKKYKN